MSEQNLTGETAKDARLFEALGDRVFAMAADDPRFETWSWTHEGVPEQGEARESVAYESAGGVPVTIWRTAGEGARTDPDRQIAFMEYWINLPQPMRFEMANGVYIQRMNFHIGVAADGEYLQSPETMVLEEDEPSFVLRTLRKLTKERKVKDEPFSLGTQYWPMSPKTKRRIAELIEPQTA